MGGFVLIGKLSFHTFLNWAFGVICWKNCRRELWKKLAHGMFELLPNSQVGEILAVGVDEVVLATDKGLRQWAADLWQDVAVWAKTSGLERHLELFTADRSDSNNTDTEEWAFVPGADLMLAIGAGIIGLSAEGVFLEALQGAPNSSKAIAKVKGGEQIEDKAENNKKKPKVTNKAQAQLAAQGKDFDWEKMWRSKARTQKWRSSQRRVSSWQHGHSPVRRSSSSCSRDRGRYSRCRGWGHRSHSRSVDRRFRSRSRSSER